MQKAVAQLSIKNATTGTAETISRPLQEAAESEMQRITEHPETTEDDQGPVFTTIGPADQAAETASTLNTGHIHASLHTAGEILSPLTTDTTIKKVYTLTQLRHYSQLKKRHPAYSIIPNTENE